MGAESYFLHLLPYEVSHVDVHGDWNWSGPDPQYAGRSSVKASLVTEAITSSFDCRWKKEDRKQLIIEDAIEVSVTELGGFLQKVTLVGCFAWYDEGLRLCWCIARTVNGCVPVRLYEQRLEYVPLSDETTFIQTMRDLDQIRYDEFLKLFGSVQKKLLPNTSFYRYYHNLHSLWGRTLNMLHDLLGRRRR